MGGVICKTGEVRSDDRDGNSNSSPSSCNDFGKPHLYRKHLSTTKHDLYSLKRSKHNMRDFNMFIFSPSQTNTLTSSDSYKIQFANNCSKRI
ncbi:hypothetical protein NQ318_019108 [Aromia moschata]|uniref:Ycf1 n=1 Tax=Aromia moschata TaxID=1265417 RepID=A0AAV8XR50_9CUCU|nr:hypothetical protein NQ318_019108 [Aromia moschata]